MKLLPWLALGAGALSFVACVIPILSEKPLFSVPAFRSKILCVWSQDLLIVSPAEIPRRGKFSLNALCENLPMRAIVLMLDIAHSGTTFTLNGSAT
jgi:hypothetical protein